MSNYLENKLADFLFRAQTFVPPATLYVALFTGAPGETGPGTEVSAAGYSRLAITSSLANWNGTHGTNSGVSSGTGGTVSNNALLTFATPNGTNAWGSVIGFGIMDASTAGNMWYYTAITSKTIGATDPAPKFDPATLTVQMDD
jgi:hypothetical protein